MQTPWVRDVDGHWNKWRASIRTAAGRPGKSTLSLGGYTVLDMPRLSLPAAVSSLLLLLTAFTVPLVAPLRASSAHLIAALAILLVGTGLAALVLLGGDGSPEDHTPSDTQIPPAG